MDSTRNINQSAESRATRMEKNKVETLVRKSNRILASISTHRFPFDLFPNTINVEESRITIINRNFFSSSQIHSVDINDVSNVFINVSYFFAQLVIVSRTFSNNNIAINYLRKNEAIHTRRIIEGLRIFENNNINTSNFSHDELLSKLEQLSTTEIVM